MFLSANECAHKWNSIDAFIFVRPTSTSTKYGRVCSPYVLFGEEKFVALLITQFLIWERPQHTHGNCASNKRVKTEYSRVNTFAFKIWDFFSSRITSTTSN